MRAMIRFASVRLLAGWLRPLHTAISLDSSAKTSRCRLVDSLANMKRFCWLVVRETVHQLMQDCQQESALHPLSPGPQPALIGNRLTARTDGRLDPVSGDKIFKGEQTPAPVPALLRNRTLHFDALENFLPIAGKPCLEWKNKALFRSLAHPLGNFRDRRQQHPLFGRETEPRRNSLECPD